MHLVQGFRSYQLQDRISKKLKTFIVTRARVFISKRPVGKRLNEKIRGYRCPKGIEQFLCLGRWRLGVCTLVARHTTYSMCVLTQLDDVFVDAGVQAIYRYVLSCWVRDNGQMGNKQAGDNKQTRLRGGG